MKKTRKYRLIIFLATFIVMMGGAFGIFMLLSYFSGAMHPTTVADVEQVATPLPAISSTSVAAATSSPTRSVKKKKTVAVASVNSPSPDIISLAFSLAGLSSLLSLMNHTVPPTATTTIVAVATEPLPPTPPTQATSSPEMATTTAPAATEPSTTTTTSTLPYSQNGFSDMEGWQRTWGTVSVASGSLAIGAPAETTGGEAILPASSGWTDYIFTATVDLVSGQTFSLEARRADSNDYLSCSFSNGGDIDSYLTENGTQYSLGSGHTSDFAFGQSVTASIEVKDSRVTCSLNGATVPQSTSYGLPADMYSGGVGVLAWSPTPGMAQILLHKISVTPP